MIPSVAKHLSNNSVPNSTNISRQDLDLILHHLRLGENLPFRIFLVTFAVIEFLVGITGNVIILVSILKFRFMRNTINAFLFNLALTDVLILIFCLPWTFAYHLYNLWFYGQFLCKMTSMIQCLATCLSIYSLVSISLRRFLIIHKRKVKFTRKEIFIWIALLWIFALIIASPLYQLYQVEEKYMDIGSMKVLLQLNCVEQWGAENASARKQLFTAFIFCILYVVPLILMSIFYGLISWKLMGAYGHSNHSQTSAVPTTSSSLTTALITQDIVNNTSTVAVDRCSLQKELVNLSRRKQATRMMMSLLAIFAICWLPYHIISLYIDFSPMQTSNEHVMNFILTVLFPLSQLFGYLNTVLDPICLFLMSPRCRLCVRLLFRRCRRRQSSRSRAYAVPELQRNLRSRKYRSSRRRQPNNLQQVNGLRNGGRTYIPMRQVRSGR